MAYKIKIDNVVYDLKDNFTVKDELNETLDSAAVEFNTYGHEANFESFDNAQIYDDANKIETKHMLVDSFDDEIHSFGETFNDDDHHYSVSLFSETKELERITMPNCTVTQPKDENETKKSVYQEIERFCSLYVPRIKVYDANALFKYNYQRKFTLDPALQTRFGAIDCPELQWNNPTLREVLNDLVSTDDCIIVVRQGIISFYDIRAKGNPIDVSKLNLSKKTMNSQDYVGELAIDMQNVIGKTASFVCEGVTLRSPQGTGTLTTENGVIRTLNPIYAIKRLRVKVPHQYRYGEDNQQTGNGYVWLDITDRVLEKEEFDLLSTVKIMWVSGSKYQQLEDFTDSNGVTVKKHKVNFLYFKRGGTEICNVGTMYQHAVDEDGTFGQRLQEVLRQVVGGGGNTLIGIGGNYDPRDFEFYLEYETIAEFSLKVGKNLPVKHPDNRIFDNQDNSYVDQEHQSVFEYAKVNRLGHKLRTICGEYYQKSDIPKLGDYIGDEILFSREITYQDNLIKFTGYMTPNYVLKDFFTGVRAKKRSWQIAKNEDALTRIDVYKLYIETSFSKKNDMRNYPDANDIITYTERRNLVYHFIPIAEQSYAQDVNFSPSVALTYGTQTKKGNTYYPSSSDIIVMDTESSILGRSACVNVGFNDNYKSADYVVQEGVERTQEFYAYADENGEYDTENVYLYYSQLKHGSDTYRTPVADINDLYFGVQAAYRKPKIAITSIPYSDYNVFQINVKKDNREIIRHNLQFEFCSDTKDIIVTDKFLSLIRFYTKTKYGFGDYKVFISTEKYELNDKTVKGTYDSNYRISKTNDNTGIENVKLSVTSSSGYATIPTGIKSWAVTDNNNNLLLAVNIQNGQTRMECWFNLIRSRDDKIYSDNYNGIVVGDITPNGIANAPTNFAQIGVTASATVNVQRRTVVRSETISGNEENE